MRIISPDAAAALIEDGWTVSTSGIGMAGYPEAIAAALERRFVAERRPRDLTLAWGSAQGDRADRGPNHFAHDGLIKRIICGHMGAARKIGIMCFENKIETYIWPQGIMTQVYRAIAGGRPGVLSAIGLHTFIDPRYEGGRCNARTTEELVEIVALKGREWMFYPAFPIHCALVRGTTADGDGNISVEHEMCFDDFLAIAQAARNSGGIVIAQVKRLSATGSLDPRLVRIPGILVDYVVVAEPVEHWQTTIDEYNPAYTGEIREPPHVFTPLPLTAEKVVQRRAFLELLPLRRPIVNLGVGMPMGIGDVAREEGASDFTLTIETGPIGGTPQSKTFGPAINPAAIVTHAEQFDFYDGGGLDIAFLGFAEADGAGNVNVSKFGGRVGGVGGFPNIAETAKTIVFCGAFNAGGLEAAIGDGRIRITKEGQHAKFVARIEQLSFNAARIAGLGRTILYVTERCVLAMRDGRFTLVEVAPGIDVRRDILDRMPFTPAISEPLATMDPRLFTDGAMGVVAKEKP
ncbi:MAG: acyl CoA:acetate/3-ketoacid CoA transferase [Alphaproteobacteria bacterium]|nr:acyl CoA:acetate/3-ketoacid CoA transferase [Alphaproteobacteria bacterium]